MDLIEPQYTVNDINISEFLTIDPTDENAGDVESIPVFFNDGSWISAPGYEDELEAFLESIR